MKNIALACCLAAAASAGLAAQKSETETKTKITVKDGKDVTVTGCVAPNLTAFQAFVAELTAAPAVRNVKTSLTLRNSKDAPMVPLELRKDA